MKKIAYISSSASFEEAFAAARAAGCQEFVLRDKRYNTRRADDPKEVKQIIERIEVER